MQHQMEMIRHFGPRLTWFLAIVFWLSLEGAGGAAVDPALLGIPDQPLTSDQRQKLIAAARGGDQWKDVSAALTRQLLSTRQTGQAWSEGRQERLRLAQAFDELGTLDTAAGLALLRRFWHGAAGKTMSDDDVRKMFAIPGAPEKLTPLFGDAANAPRGELVARRVPPEVLDQILNNPVLLEQLGRVVGAQDYWPGVWRVLGDLVAHSPGLAADYAALFAAFSVVHDQAFPVYWPHGQVKREDLPLVYGQWNALLDYWVQKDQAGTLMVNLKTLRPDQLIFLVDVGVKVDELAWAADTIHERREHFDRVFSMVTYDKSRIAANQFIWPGDKPYTLADILSNGGICVDQAYFAYLAGKAFGLPTLFFSGQGRDGGHAWFGYLKQDDAWDMEAGRYSNQNYVVGEALNPQTWEAINDHQLDQISREMTVSESMQESRDSLTLATLAGGLNLPEEQQRMLQDARTICPDNTEAWLEIARYLQQTNQTFELEQHWQSMMEQFQGDRDLKVYILQQLIVLKTAQNKTEEVAALQEQIINDNRNKRSDLSVGSVWDKIQADLDQENWDGAMDTYRSELRSLQATGGGNLFYEVVRPFVLRLIKSEQKDRARQAIKWARQYLQMDDTSILGKDTQTLEDQIETGLPAAQ